MRYQSMLNLYKDLYGGKPLSKGTEDFLKQQSEAADLERRLDLALYKAIAACPQVKVIRIHGSFSVEGSPEDTQHFTDILQAELKKPREQG